MKYLAIEFQEICQQMPHNAEAHLNYHELLSANDYEYAKAAHCPTTSEASIERMTGGMPNSQQGVEID